MTDCDVSSPTPRFRSTLGPTFTLKFFGVPLIGWSIILALKQAFPGENSGIAPFSIDQLPFHLVLWAVGIFVFLCGCEVEIDDENLRYRRLISWRSITLSQVTKVYTWGPAVWINFRCGNKRGFLVFDSEGKINQPHPPPIVQFMKTVAMRNRSALSMHGP
jgi:hypothetical protein